MGQGTWWEYASRRERDIVRKGDKEMCLDCTGKRVSSRKTPLKVWKVTNKDRCTLFRTINGYQSTPIFNDRLPKLLPKRSKDFVIGLGYCLFEKDRDARAYMADISSHRDTILLKPELHRAIIPAGIKFQRGAIKRGLKGEGLNAIRTEQYRFNLIGDEAHGEARGR